MIWNITSIPGNTGNWITFVSTRQPQTLLPNQIKAYVRAVAQISYFLSNDIRLGLEGLFGAVIGANPRSDLSVRCEADL